MAGPLRSFLITLRRLVTEQRVAPTAAVPTRVEARPSAAARGVVAAGSALLEHGPAAVDEVVLAHHCATWAREVGLAGRRDPATAVLVDALGRLERAAEALAAADAATRDQRVREAEVAARRVALAVGRPAAELVRGR